LEIFGFTKPDILEYLDVSQFVSSAESWAELVKAWRSRGMEPSFKDWLRDQGATISAPAVRKAVQHMDEVPAEFYELLQRCRRAAGLLPPSLPSQNSPG